MPSEATNMRIRDNHISPYIKIIAIYVSIPVEIAMRSIIVPVRLFDVTCFEVNYYKVRGECLKKPQIW